MAKDIIGYLKCPHCGYEDAEVKETKKTFQSRALVMVWCPHPKCQSQHFPRSKDGSDRIRNNMREVTGNVEPAEILEPETTAPPPVKTPAKQTFEDFMNGK